MYTTEDRFVLLLNALEMNWRPIWIEKLLSRVPFMEMLMQAAVEVYCRRY
jgi:hypothetical protein